MFTNVFHCHDVDDGAGYFDHANQIRDLLSFI